MTAPSHNTSPLAERLHALLHHLQHRLPGQAPLQDFVHHNTLHGYEHLPFAEALAAVYRRTGLFGYLPVAEFRRLYREGRITPAALRQELLAMAGPDPMAVAAELADGPLRRWEICRAVLLYDMAPLSPPQLSWLLEEWHAATTFRPQVSSESRCRLLRAAAVPEAAALSDLWQLCQRLTRVDDPPPPTHEPLEEVHWQGQPRHEARKAMALLFQEVGSETTLRGLLLSLTGHDILEAHRPDLLRFLATYADQGMAVWRRPGPPRGLYGAWRDHALSDLSFLPEELPGWREEIESFPEEAMAAIETALQRLGLAEELWDSYLERLAMEIPGWSGMILWRHHHPGYQGLTPSAIDFFDYLAIRLILERLHAVQLCLRLWQVEPRLDIIAWHFRQQEAEFTVRAELFKGALPEFLATQAQSLVSRANARMVDEAAWIRLAFRIWRHRHLHVDHAATRSWPLFCLLQHLGLCAREVRQMSPEAQRAIQEGPTLLNPLQVGQLWLQAYERSYRDPLLNALTHHLVRHPERREPLATLGQVVFCMDEREEGFRRHLEVVEPAITTYGAAGFFGVAIRWLGLDDSRSSALCPVVVTPAHEIHEISRPEADALLSRHRQRRARRLRWLDLFHQGTRRGWVWPGVLSALGAPAALALTAARLAAPLHTGRWLENLAQRLDLPVPTTVTLSRQEAAPRLGFTPEEQTERVANLLATIGLTRDFAPLVVLMGHGSMSRNNPHLAAYDCGACSGRHGGPNARVFAAMANSPEVRQRLVARQIHIPATTWFLAAEHNTGDETIAWFDPDRLPPQHQETFQRLQQALDQARGASAHERCRRLASAPRTATHAQALAHMQARALDFSQARPELGHATNAAALVGRRAATRGLFLDRRMFLISYDPEGDPQGRILENILLAVGPVGSGINLEYYFSTVDNDGFGCGSKITHNVTGLLGVMEGATSDLRTGLPKQMIEIHEAMRLLLIVEQTPALLAAIAQRQPVVRQLVENGWLQLASLDPHGREIHLYQPGAGWLPWHCPLPPPPRPPSSRDWYAGHQQPRPPALLPLPGENRHG